MSRRKNDIILENLKVEAIAAEGKCIAHTPEGQVVFMPYAVPGDVVNVRVLKKKKNYIEARITEILEPSKDRIAPFCRHFGICGGCNWQHIPYSLQLQAKQQQVLDQLTRIGHLELPPCSPIIASDKIQEYRNKLEFSALDKRWIHTDEDPETIPEDQRMGLGFHISGFFDKVLDINKCYLQPEPSNAIRLFVKDFAVKHHIPFYNTRENRGVFRNMFVRTNDKGEVMVILCFATPLDEVLTELLNSLSDTFPQIVSLYYVINQKLNDSIADQDCLLYRGEDAIYETMGKLKFKIGPKSFYQTNNSGAFKLYSKVKEFAEIQDGSIVYDLYTGTGTIAQFVSEKAAKVIGIEYVSEAIEDAKINAQINNITNCEFFAGDMKDILTEDFISIHGKPDVIITDPPRAGMHPDVIKTILKVSPKTIVYVSCNPASQARDLELLSIDYKIVEIQAVDMFPHTVHIENIVKLLKK